MIRTEDYKRELFSIFFAQKKIIFWTAFLIFLGAVLIAYYYPPTYSASGSILVRGKEQVKTPESLEQPESRLFSLTQEDLSSEAEIITSPDVIGRTIKYIEAQGRPLFDPASMEETPSFIEQVHTIRNSLQIEVLPTSNVISIEFFSKDSDKAVDVLSILLDQYLSYRIQLYNPSESEIFFSRQADKFLEGLKSKEAELLGLVEETEVSDAQKEIENLLWIRRDLELDLNRERNTFIETKLGVEHLEQALREKDFQYFSFIDSRAINDLSVRLLDLYVERGNVLRTYHPLSEKAKSMDELINNTYASLKSEVESYKDNLLKEVAISEKKIQQMEKTLEEYNNRNVALERQLIESQSIAREMDLLQFSYETFSKRKEEATINRAVDSSNLSTYVSILSYAFPSNGPVFPKKNVVIPLGLLIGLITGCSLGFLSEYFDHTFKKPSDVISFAGLPVIFSIARYDKLKWLKSIAWLLVWAVAIAVVILLLSKFQIIVLPFN